MHPLSFPCEGLGLASLRKGFPSRTLLPTCLKRRMRAINIRKPQAHSVSTNFECSGQASDSFITVKSFDRIDRDQKLLWHQETGGKKIRLYLINGHCQGGAFVAEIDPVITINMTRKPLMKKEVAEFVRSREPASRRALFCIHADRNYGSVSHNQSGNVSEIPFSK